MGPTSSPRLGPWVLPPLLVLALAACGMKPYQNPNHREEGGQYGLLTGPEGEWVIYRSEGPATRLKDKSDGATPGKAERTPLEAPPTLE